MPSSYSKFTNYEDLKALGIEVRNKRISREAIAIEPTNWLRDTLLMNSKLPLATEKAKSELIVVPILTELVTRNNYAFTYFSGYTFNVDKAQGLVGACDFLLSTEVDTPMIAAPIISVVEAKRDNLDNGIPQCIAQMYAAQLFNIEAKSDVTTIYGAVSTGGTWQFLYLKEKAAFIDTQVFYINQDLPELLGAFQQIIDFYIK